VPTVIRNASANPISGTFNNPVDVANDKNGDKLHVSYRRGDDLIFTFVAAVIAGDGNPD
jgi:hypothetical protein